MLLLLEFSFDHSEIFTGETRHIVPPYNKARISDFCLEFQKLQKLQISSKRYSSFSSYSIILIFFPDKLGIYIVSPCNKAGISNFRLDFQEFQEFQISLKRYSSFSSYWVILNSVKFFSGALFGRQVSLSLCFDLTHPRTLDLRLPHVTDVRLYVTQQLSIGAFNATVHLCHVEHREFRTQPPRTRT